MHYRQNAPPATPPPHEVVARGPLRYVEYPQEPDVPSHLVTGALLYKGMAEKMAEAFPGFVKPFSALTPPMYKLVPVKGAGLGVIATADIARGQPIMRERPLLFYPIALPFHVGNVDVYEFMVSSLRPENREAVYALANVKGPEWPSHLKGIVDTNAFGFSTPIPGYSWQYAALGRDVSRINHSCVANAMWFWDLETLTFTVSAHTPIRAGEEVTIAYTASPSRCAKRQEVLSSRYKFTCKCPACALDPAGRLTNDMQRLSVNLFDLDEQGARDALAFDRWLSDGAPVQLEADGVSVMTTPVDFREFAREVEHLDGFARARFALACMLALRYFRPNLWEPVIARVVKGYAVLEDEERVREHALLAAGLKMAHTGSDGGWSEVARRPRDTDWWGRLGEKRVR